MKLLYNKYIMLAVFLSLCLGIHAQTAKWRDMHKVKKRETIFGIARDYGITVEELIDANPEMKQQGYELKKDDFIFIPYPKNKNAVAVKSTVTAENKAKPVNKSNADIGKREIRIGVMLPLHNNNGDGKRMLEYYRGILMACDKMKKEGISTDIKAWNVPIDANVQNTLLEKGADKCDIIFGPLYTNMVRPLAEFCKQNDTKLVIPFSISGNHVALYNNIFQVYQTNEELNQRAIDSYMERFPNHHPVFIDCNDTTSRKGIFTFGLRKRLDAKGVKYNITNLKSSEEMFAKAFSRTQPNIVILNTGRSPELTVAFAKIEGLRATVPGLSITMFGYTEWLMYENNINNYYKNDVYIPSTFYYNPLSADTRLFENEYYTQFGENMMYALPHFALIGYDHAYYFIRGLHKYGKTFKGSRAENVSQPIQTPLRFVQVGSGGYKNHYFELIHYKPNRTIESISY